MKKTILSSNQSELLENLIVKHGQIVTSDQVFTEAKQHWDYRQARNLVTRLADIGWLIRIKRGLYAISDLSSRGFLTLSPYIVANLLVPNSYVSFETALQHYGMFDQLTGKTVSVSLKMYKDVNLAGTEYRFVKTKAEYYFGWQEVSIGNQIARLATPEKAIIDLVAFHKSRYSIDLVIEKLIEHRSDLIILRLTEYLTKMPLVTIKIFGLIFDLLGINSDTLAGFVKPGGTHWMIPGDTKFNARWRLYYHEDLDKYKTT